MKWIKTSEQKPPKDSFFIAFVGKDVQVYLCCGFTAFGEFRGYLICNQIEKGFLQDKDIDRWIPMPESDE